MLQLLIVLLTIWIIIQLSPILIALGFFAFCLFVGLVGAGVVIGVIYYLSNNPDIIVSFFSAIPDILLGIVFFSIPILITWGLVILVCKLTGDKS